MRERLKQVAHCTNTSCDANKLDPDPETPPADVCFEVHPEDIVVDWNMLSAILGVCPACGSEKYHEAHPNMWRCDDCDNQWTGEEYA